MAAELTELPDLPRNEDGPVFAEPWQASAFALAVSLSHHHCWLATLERLVVAKRLSDPTALSDCKAAWAEAYRRTPHGKPVELT
jgi:hypothetical protein